MMKTHKIYGVGEFLRLHEDKKKKKKDESD